MYKFLAAALALASISAPAHALVLVSQNDNGVGTSNVASSVDTLGVDYDFTGFGTIDVTFTVEAADIAAPLAFNSNINNFIGLGISDLNVTIAGATFDVIGSVTPSFSLLNSLTVTGNELDAVFTDEPFSIVIGDPLVTGQGTDFTIDFSAANVGDTFTISVTAAPEPASIALFGLGMLAAGAAVRRRRA